MKTEKFHPDLVHSIHVTRSCRRNKEEHISVAPPLPPVSRLSVWVLPSDPFMWCGSIPAMAPRGPSEPGPIGNCRRRSIITHRRRFLSLDVSQRRTETEMDVWSLWALSEGRWTLQWSSVLIRESQNILDQKCSGTDRGSCLRSFHSPLQTQNDSRFLLIQSSRRRAAAFNRHSGDLWKQAGDFQAKKCFK